MDFFNVKTDSEIIPATPELFAIVDPNLSHNETDSQNQILMFWYNSTIDDNEKLRKIGIIQGINEFTKSFTTNDEQQEQGQQEKVRYIELDNQLILFDIWEDKYQVILSINLTKIKDENAVEFIQNDISPITFLKKLINQGYNEFKLHNGTITKISQTLNSNDFKEFLNNWWIIWLKNLQLEIIENGVMKLYNGFKKSSSYQSITTDLSNLFIFNTNKTNFENYGLIYTNNKLSSQSQISLLNWIEELDNYELLNTQGLILSQVLKTPILTSGQSNGSTQEIVYDPFKLVLNTLSEVSKISGVTAGVNASVNGISSGINTINGYLPNVSRLPEWMGGGGGNGGDVNVEEEARRQGYEPIENAEEHEKYLIGKIDGNIIKKEVWLDNDDDYELKKYNVVVYQKDDLLYLYVLDDFNGDLDDGRYYDELKQKFNEISTQLSIKISENKGFYFLIYDQFHKSIESNLPNIPTFDNEEVNDLKYFHDLTSSKTQSQYLHRELIKILGTITPDQIETLKRTKNGWWILRLLHQGKEILIIKKWSYSNGVSNKTNSVDPIRERIFQNSTSLIGSIGKDAKIWLDDYLTKNKI
ncbi:Vacuolar fusion protein CCZ1 [Wickerhamomyces ciferrii]|uniref:Vacuolar fusion protein CCZ1 n=1 Tax=Wickerhamomyces ciferrii (strain ATCC 14091 / BCRC 22168 / CBS 111 / JCM 3599 / NBRC 0793 / NRRL Y-1031 F-60-10) TaxID=1206466 RepID=K0KGT5_WICCF|nr:Vacuolar fusion protein CCZ1 [Wickerhamomyces ciferrii]CCH42191.1 Vacuolar fusion protein CCZ1 [Wickerhamomyces ciferrii]